MTKWIVGLLTIMTAINTIPLLYITKDMKNIHKSLSIHDDQLEFSNVLKFRDEEYLLFGFNGVEYIDGKWAAYSPIYMKEYDLIRYGDDQWKKQIEKINRETGFR